MNVLIGKKISGIEIAKDKEALRFLIVGDDPIVARCDADCCSYTWVENVENTVIFPANVVSVDDIDLNSDLDDRCGEIAFYGCKITTDRGYIIIDYRNESNGYYGGSLSWPDDDYFYGGVFGQNVSKEEWERVE